MPATLSALLRRGQSLGRIGCDSIYVGDPLTGSMWRVSEALRAGVAVHTVVVDGHVALLGARIPGAKPTAHDHVGAVVIDAGVCALAASDTPLEFDQVSLVVSGRASAQRVADAFVCKAGYGDDGNYPVFVERAKGACVGVWIDFGVVEIRESIKAREAVHSIEPLVALLDAAQTALRDGRPLPDVSPLLRARAAFRRKLAPQLVALLAAPTLPAPLGALARAWSDEASFQAALCKVAWSEERWCELMLGFGVLDAAVEVRPGLQRHLAVDPTVPVELRYKYGDSATLWSEASMRNDDLARVFFLRPGVRHAAPSPDAAMEVERRYHSRGDYEVVSNLRAGRPPSLPGGA